MPDNQSPETTPKEVRWTNDTEYGTIVSSGAEVGRLRCHGTRRPALTTHHKGQAVHPGPHGGPYGFMMDSLGETTASRIEASALRLILHQGVQKTNLAEVAHAAGITRVTVYRCFGDKRGLLRAVCLQIARLFQQAAQTTPDDSVEAIDVRLQNLAIQLRQLPSGNLLARLEEISRLYPDVYQEFRQVRESAIDAIFQRVLEVAGRDGLLREGLKPEVLKVIFWTMVVGLIENPALISSNVPLAEVCATVTEVFRHGILKQTAGAACAVGQTPPRAKDS